MRRRAQATLSGLMRVERHDLGLGLAGLSQMLRAIEPDAVTAEGVIPHLGRADRPVPHIRLPEVAPE